MMQRDIFSCLIAHHVRRKLMHSGYVFSKDFDGITVEKLSSDVGLTSVEAENVLASLGVTPQSHDQLNLTNRKPILASDHLKQTNQLTPIVTFSQTLDEMLGGGIALGRLTEVCGMPGSGKTQLCLQLSVNVQIPEYFGGLGGEALFIDTEGSFNIERLLDVATAVANHFNPPTVPSKKLGEEKQFSVDGILRSVHYYRCIDFAAFMGLINFLPSFVNSHPKTKLIIIDNITYHFRHNFDSNYQLRTNLLQSASSALNELANKHLLAVVATNQMTTRISKTGESSIVPALGDNWSHVCCNRLCLANNDNDDDDKRRSVTFMKSSYAQSACASFYIEAAGIRDVLFQTASTDLSNRRTDHHQKFTRGQNSNVTGNYENVDYDIQVPASKRLRLEHSDNDVE